MQAVLMTRAALTIRIAPITQQTPITQRTPIIIQLVLAHILQQALEATTKD